MADITMCQGNGCPRKESCYRHTAPANPYRQSWFMKSPLDDKTLTCDEWWDNSGYRVFDKTQK